MIKNKNKLSYNIDDTIYKLIINNDEIKLVRENNEFIHTFVFKINKETISEYYIKEYASSIEIKIITTNIIIRDNKIEIAYLIKDSNEKYNYILDME